MKATVTSWDDASTNSGNVVNETHFTYNNFGQLTHDYQAHSGTVNVMTTPKVQYAFASGADNTIRPTSVTYPDGRVISYDCGGHVSRYRLFDRSRLQLADLNDRESDVGTSNIVALQPVSVCVPTIDHVVAAIVAARNAGHPVIMMIGGHPIKLGLSRFLIQLMESGYITCLATNGAGIIHDFELAAFGETSENVSRWIKTGQFGLWQQTDQLNQIVNAGCKANEGLGEATGRWIEEKKLPHRNISVAAAAWRSGVPMTCHVSIGSDIFHGYPNCNGAALGQVSHTDFLIFAKQIQDLEGGVFLNVGSAVTGPEVYLTALSMARNVARQNGETISDFTTAVLDVVELPENWVDGPGRPPQGKNAATSTHPMYYFRPWKTILCRTVNDGGRSYYIRGDHRQTIPALWQGLCHRNAPENRDSV